jgi:hypothetical protein
MGAAPRNDKVCGYMEGEIASSLQRPRWQRLVGDVCEDADGL